MGGKTEFYNPKRLCALAQSDSYSEHLKHFISILFWRRTFISGTKTSLDFVKLIKIFCESNGQVWNKSDSNAKESVVKSERTILSLDLSTAALPASRPGTGKAGGWLSWASFEFRHSPLWTHWTPYVPTLLGKSRHPAAAACSDPGHIYFYLHKEMNKWI